MIEIRILSTGVANALITCVCEKRSCDTGATVYRLKQKIMRWVQIKRIFYETRKQILSMDWWQQNKFYYILNVKDFYRCTYIRISDSQD